MRTALIALALALAASGCAHGERAERDCASANVRSALQSLPGILSLWSPPPPILQSGFILCSRYEDRLIAASSALGAEGYSSYIGVARMGKCLRVARTHEATPAALEREIRTMCRIADAHRITYRLWKVQAEVELVPIRGDRRRIGGKARRS